MLNAMKRYDVYAWGVLAPSTLHVLEGSFPPPDGYAEIAGTYPMTGGEALNSSIVLTRLGRSVFLDGMMLGDTPEGKWLRASIRGFGIDAPRLRVKRGDPVIREIVFSDERSRSIFATYVKLNSGERRWNIPRKRDMTRARIACIDPPFGAESDLAGVFAKELGLPFVTVDCAYTRKLATDAAAVIISGEFRDREYPGAAIDTLFGEYVSRCSGLVVFTVGAKDIIYGRTGRAPRHLAPFQVRAVDTAGAGDSFRSGLIHGMLEGWDDERCVEYAAAVSALICTTFPGVMNAPDRAAVDGFLSSRKTGAPAGGRSDG